MIANCELQIEQCLLRTLQAIEIFLAVEIMAISPWADRIELRSPDGHILARIDDAFEIGMGAPTFGTLILSNGMTRDSCNPSIIWSDDSEYVAVPQWTKQRKQRLMIISMSRRTSRYFPSEYRVLQLDSFSSGIIQGIDSPIFMPYPIELDIKGIEW